MEAHRDRQIQTHREAQINSVCVCERERETGREGEGERKSNVSILIEIRYQKRTITSSTSGYIII
jgi:hypothetical protein